MNRGRAGLALLLLALPARADAGELPVLDLAAAKALALERQPAIAAARASLNAALARKQAIDNLRVPTFLQRDLPIRRQQAAHGPVAAQAGVLLAEMNTVYGVQFSYLTYLYARTQEQLGDDALERLDRLEDFLTEVVKAMEKDPAFETEFLSADRERVRAMVRLARGRREEARVGSRRALSALREAIGLDANCPLLLANDRLLDVSPDVDCKAMVDLALAHRPEIVQVSVAEQVHQLEVAAQEARKRSLRVSTFASGSDIHVQPLPAGSYDNRYSPQAVGPEMPVTLAGRQCDRVAVASNYHDRSLSVIEKTRNLIRLEVEQACLRYQEARGKLAELEQGIAHATKAAAGLREALSLGRGARAKAESLLNASLLGSQLRVLANEARYEMLLALAALERATAGTYCAGLDKAPEKAREPITDKKAPKSR